ncbi:MAG TPA: transcriptional regulator GcvA [Ferrovibrio sp.]|uniref:transcriptional regulator GcvA n=1 Tax=Ferrovibrio sp. TaxID=1917215 RepID=UPI002ECFE48D
MRPHQAVKFAPDGAPSGPRGKRRLPPLVALRTFEVVARHLSLIRAADELCVTPAAVSHQIRTLEAHLGLQLFQRSGRNITLTEAGQACLPGIRGGFEMFADAIAQLETLSEGGVLTVSVAPSFAVKWLVPRLGRFQQSHPNIDVRVAASNQLANFVSDNVDIAIRYGKGHYADVAVERLLPETVFPVCSPMLLERHRLKTPKDLAAVTLLHDDSPDDDHSCPSWQAWLQAAGVEAAEVNRGLRFTQSSLVLDAAIHGKGVALAKAVLAQADIAAGRLVRLFRKETPLDYGYFIVAPPRKLSLPKVAAFAAWLRAEAMPARAADKTA